MVDKRFRHVLETDNVLDSFAKMKSHKIRQINAEREKFRQPIWSRKDKIP